MKDSDKNKESSHLKYWDVNNLYSWAMSKNLPVNNFKCIEDIFEFDESFIKSYNDESDDRYFLEVDVQYFETLRDLHNDLPFLNERKTIEKVEKLITNLHDKTEHAVHIKNLKQALKSWISFEKSS